MDLSFHSFDRASELVAWPGDLAALMVGVAARQGGSPTALAQARLPAGRKGRRGAASFNPAVAALLAAFVAPRADAAAGTGGAAVNGPFTNKGQGVFKPGRYVHRIAILSGTGAPHEDR